MYKIGWMLMIKKDKQEHQFSQGKEWLKKPELKLLKIYIKKYMMKLERIHKEQKRKKKNINIQEIEKIKALLLDQMVNNSEEMLDLTTNKEKIELMKKWPNSLKLEKLI